MDEQTTKQKVNLPWLPTHNKPSAVAVGEIVPEEAAPKAEEFINTDACERICRMVRLRLICLRLSRIYEEE